MEHIGKYPITSVIGAGGFGTVYAATDPDTGETVAVKVLNLPGDNILRAMFRSEVAAMLTVSHPNVVRVRDVIDTAGMAALVTDFVDGVTLRQAVRELGPLDGRQSLVVLSGALQGLAAVHAAGLVHADLKPENILIDSQGQSRLIDFGLAGPPRPLAGPGTWSGTPAYISPEQVAGHHVDARSDIYAMGVLLFELLCGRQPYKAETAELTAQLHLTAAVPDPRTFVPDLGDGLVSICRLDLSKDPAQRHQNAVAFHTSLGHAAQQRHGAAWAAGAGLGGVIGAVIAALPAGSGLLGAGVAGSAAVGTAGAAALGGTVAVGGSATVGGTAGTTGVAGAAGSTASSGTGLLGALGTAKAAIAGATAVAVVGVGAGAAYLAAKDDEPNDPAPAAAIVHDVFSYRTTSEAVVVKDGREITRLPQKTEPGLAGPATAWSADGATFAAVDGESLTLLDLETESTSTASCSKCSSVALWGDRVVTIVNADHPDKPTLVTRPVDDLTAEPTALIADPPEEMQWSTVTVAGNDLVVTGNNDVEAGAHGAADAYIVDEGGSATRVGDHTLLNYVAGVAAAPETAYGGPRAALAIAGTGGACTAGMYVSLVDPADTSAAVETDVSQMFPDPATSMYLESIDDLWFGADGQLRASAHRSGCDWDAGPSPDRAIQLWRLDQDTWVLDDARAVLAARDLPSGAHLELVAANANPATAAVAQSAPAGRLTLVDGDESMEVAHDVVSISAPPPTVSETSGPTLASPTEPTESTTEQLAPFEGPVEFSGTGDQPATNSLPSTLKSYLTSEAEALHTDFGDESQEHCKASGTWIRLDAFDERGYARGIKQACTLDAFQVLWWNDQGTWKIAADGGYQTGWQCSDLKAARVPSDFLGDDASCNDANGNQTTYSGP